MSNMDEKKFVLASGSPRRKFLLESCGFSPLVSPSNADEDFDPSLPPEQVPGFLAKVKALASRAQHPDAEIILTADTVVILEGTILNKPIDESDAVIMLRKLSGKFHSVITAVGLSTPGSMEVIGCKSTVYFRALDEREIEHYVRNFRPLDKAGSYGAQECLPEGYDPCTKEEQKFLSLIGKPNLLAESKPNFGSIRPMIAIEKIEGSYFNVMGLPIHMIYPKIFTYINK